jgi:hypothetical protein
MTHPLPSVPVLGLINPLVSRASPQVCIANGYSRCYIQKTRKSIIANGILSRSLSRFYAIAESCTMNGMCLDEWCLRRPYGTPGVWLDAPTPRFNAG